MGIGLIVLGALLALAAAGSGISKLAKAPVVMASMSSVGVRPQQIPVLAALELAGALGLLLGIWTQPLGVAAAACLAAYFLGAVVSHLRKGHGPAEYGAAAVIFLIAVAVTALQVGR